MLDALDRALDQLPAILAEPAGLEGWHSLDVDYHPPRVERLFRPFEDGRLYLHRIHPCGPGEALLHPHPWPCAILVLGGAYEMGIGAGPGLEPPTVITRVIAGPGFRYEMTDPDAWHYVRPLDGPALSVMVTGQPWDRPSPRPDNALGPLAVAAQAALLAAVSQALLARPESQLRRKIRGEAARIGGASSC